jgi:ectoine hydroxylase-related dioxygenase (phytanoyl-CoA dioxygenase family)
MVKWKRTKGQTMIHKALHRKLMIEQHESHCEYEKRNISVGHIWPRICSNHVTENCVTNDHGYVPSTLRKTVSHMTTDMFQPRYGKLCHIWPRICSKHVTENCVTYDHKYVPNTLRKPVRYDHGYVPRACLEHIRGHLWQFAVTCLEYIVVICDTDFRGVFSSWICSSAD